MFTFLKNNSSFPGMKKFKKWLFLLILFLFLGVGLRYWINSPNRSFLIKPICSFETNEKQLILTFDDGPGQATPALLKLLAEQNIKAVFFVNGTKLERFPEIAKEIVSQGHIMANHSFKHETMTFKSFDYIEKDMLKTDSLIRLAGQKELLFYRPPYGKSFINLPRVLKKHQKKIFNWSIAPKAQYAATYSRENMVHQTIEQLHPGGILLLHDGWDNLKPEVLVDMVNAIVQAIRKEGYSFVLPD